MCLTAVKNHKTIVMEVDTAFSTATLSVLLAHLTIIINTFYAAAVGVGGIKRYHDTSVRPSVPWRSCPRL